jgi:hypothetical protein
MATRTYTRARRIVRRLIDVVLLNSVVQEIAIGAGQTIECIVKQLALVQYWETEGKQSEMVCNRKMEKARPARTNVTVVALGGMAGKCECYILSGTVLPTGRTKSLARGSLVPGLGVPSDLIGLIGLLGLVGVRPRA